METGNKITKGERMEFLIFGIVICLVTYFTDNNKGKK